MNQNFQNDGSLKFEVHFRANISFSKLLKFFKAYQTIKNLSLFCNSKKKERKEKDVLSFLRDNELADL